MEYKITQEQLNVILHVLKTAELKMNLNDFSVVAAVANQLYGLTPIEKKSK